MKCELFNLLTVKGDTNKSNRIIIPGKDFTKNILTNFGFNISNLPMIVNTVNWEISINKESGVGQAKANYKILNYGGYYYNYIEKNKKNHLYIIVTKMQGFLKL